MYVTPLQRPARRLWASTRPLFHCSLDKLRISFPAVGTIGRPVVVRVGRTLPRPPESLCSGAERRGRRSPPPEPTRSRSSPSVGGDERTLAWRGGAGGKRGPI